MERCVNIDDSDYFTWNESSTMKSISIVDKVIIYLQHVLKLLVFFYLFSSAYRVMNLKDIKQILYRSNMKRKSNLFIKVISYFWIQENFVSGLYCFDCNAKWSSLHDEYSCPENQTQNIKTWITNSQKYSYSYNAPSCEIYYRISDGAIVLQVRKLMVLSCKVLSLFPNKPFYYKSNQLISL